MALELWRLAPLAGLPLAEWLPSVRFISAKGNPASDALLSSTHPPFALNPGLRPESATMPRSFETLCPCIMLARELTPARAFTG